MNTLTVPELDSVPGSLALFGNTVLPSVAFPQLIKAGYLNIQNNSGIVSLSFPLLTRLDNTIATSMIIGCPALTTISWPQLAFAHPFDIENNNALTSFSCPSLATWAGGSVTNCANLTSVNIDALANLTGSISFNSDKLPSAQVNYVLHKLVLITPPVANKTFDLSQSIAAPPIGQGITDKATLVARPNTVITN